jgi:hypothetical protein
MKVGTPLMLILLSCIVILSCEIPGAEIISCDENNRAEVTITNEAPIRGLQFRVTPLNEYITLIDVSTTARTEGFFVTFDPKSGTVALASLSGQTIAPGSGPIVELIFDVSEDAPGGICGFYLEDFIIG